MPWPSKGLKNTDLTHNSIISEEFNKFLEKMSLIRNQNNREKKDFKLQRI